MLIGIIIWITGIYAALCVLLFFFQHFFFFRPEVLPSSFKYDYPFEFEEHDFEMEDGGTVNSILFKVPNSRGLLYFFKGNSRSIKGWGKFAKDFISNGYDFFIMDYRGFGKSTGKVSETKLYNDSQQIYKWLAKKYTEEKIIIYGRSYGSGISARVASWNNPAMLILDSPYYSFQFIAKRFGWFLPLKYILRYKIPTNKFLTKMSAHTHIIHGTKDMLIPYNHSELLKEDIGDNLTLHPVEGAGHNNLPAFAVYHQILYKLLNKAANQKKKIA